MVAVVLVILLPASLVYLKQLWTTPSSPHNTDTNILEQVLNKYDCHEWQKF